MLRRQVLVAIGMTASVVILLLLYSTPGLALRFAPPLGDDEAARLAYAARWLLVPALCLFAGIAAVANRRFFLPEAMDGTRAPESRSLEINLRYNQNTLEQTVLAAVAWTGLALVLPHERLGLIGMLAVLFAAGRVLFWIGYLIAPWARAIGFGLTFYPTAVVLVWLALRAFA
ncbi:MAG: MAPEG family protein [Rhizomicrobium sp.]